MCLSGVPTLELYEDASNGHPERNSLRVERQPIRVAMVRPVDEGTANQGAHQSVCREGMDVDTLMEQGTTPVLLRAGFRASVHTNHPTKIFALSKTSCIEIIITPLLVDTLINLSTWTHYSL